MVIWLILMLLVVGVVAGVGITALGRDGQLQFSLRSIFFVTTYVGLVVAVIMESDLGWIFLPIAFGSLAVALLGLIYRRGERRAYWVGFSIFGAAYVVALWLLEFPFSRPRDGIFLALALPLSLLGAYVARYFHRTQEVIPEPDVED